MHLFFVDDITERYFDKNFNVTSTIIGDNQQHRHVLHANAFVSHPRVLKISSEMQFFANGTRVALASDEFKIEFHRTKMQPTETRMDSMKHHFISLRGTDLKSKQIFLEDGKTEASSKSECYSK